MSDVAKSVSDGKSDHAKILTTAKERLKMAMEALSDSREDELDDLKFRAASPDNQWQWPDDVLATRGATNGQTLNARPCLTINKLPQHVLQVTNDQRQNRPSGKVIPVDDDADIEVAEVLEGVVRHIEYISDADVAYDTACDNQVTFGEGYFRILTDYVDEMSFDQEIKIGRIRNSFSVYMDPSIQDPCGSDAQWCQITQDLLHDEFEREFPNAKPISSILQGVGDEQLSGWVTNKTVRVAEYFYKDYTEKTLLLYPGGVSTLQGSPEEKRAKEIGLLPVKKRTTSLCQVKWCKHNGFEILEGEDEDTEGNKTIRNWAGKWIPVIRVIGNEFEIEGQLYVSGLVRNAKDAQRMYNYWASQEVEMLALAPKAPFVGYGGQFEGYENQWKTANVNNWPYLEVNPDAADPEGKPFPLPQRAQPPLPQVGIIQAKMGAADDIKGTTGQYDPSLGAESNEKSGIAIRTREKQSDTGTYHYVDNLARAVRYGTRQIVDLIPKIYDTKRIARIVGIDGETEQVQFDPEQKVPVQKIKLDDGSIKKIYNPGIGKYDVAVTTGASHATKRQEAAEAMLELSRGVADPVESKVTRYFAVKNLDVPDAQEYAQAIKNLLPPGILDNKDEGPSPELKQAMEMVQKLTEQVHELIDGQEAIKAEREVAKSEIEAYRAETDRIKAVQPMSPEDIQKLVQQTLREVANTPDPSVVAQQPAMQGA